MARDQLGFRLSREGIFIIDKEMNSCPFVSCFLDVFIDIIQGFGIWAIEYYFGIRKGLPKAMEQFDDFFVFEILKYAPCRD